MKNIQLLVAVMIALIVGSSNAWADNTLWGKLETDENLIVFMRHAYSSGGSPITWDETGNCKGERRLTRRGEELARDIGREFQAHGIKPVVISSPMCRCLETAQIAFGGSPLTAPELRETATADEDGLQAFESTARSLIVSKRGVRPLVFVSHRPNIDQLTMELIGEGDLLVGEIGENGDIDVIGKISIDR